MTNKTIREFNQEIALWANNLNMTQSEIFNLSCYMDECIAKNSSMGMYISKFINKIKGFKNESAEILKVNITIYTTLYTTLYKSFKIISVAALISGSYFMSATPVTGVIVSAALGGALCLGDYYFNNGTVICITALATIGVISVGSHYGMEAIIDDAQFEIEAAQFEISELKKTLQFVRKTTNFIYKLQGNIVQNLDINTGYSSYSSYSSSEGSVRPYCTEEEINHKQTHESDASELKEESEISDNYSGPEFHHQLPPGVSDAKLVYSNNHYDMYE